MRVGDRVIFTENQKYRGTIIEQIGEPWCSTDWFVLWDHPDLPDYPVGESEEKLAPLPILDEIVEVLDASEAEE